MPHAVAAARRRCWPLAGFADEKTNDLRAWAAIAGMAGPGWAGARGSGRLPVAPHDDDLSIWRRFNRLDTAQALRDQRGTRPQARTAASV